MNAREKLAAACRTQPSRKAMELLEIGETVSFIGRPAPVESGCISLRIAGGFTVSVQDTAVIDVEEEDGLYIVTVKAGSSAVVRFESTVTLKSSSGPCSCSHADKEAEPGKPVSRISGGHGTFGGLNETIDRHWCQVGYICHPYWIKGERREFCVFVIWCSNT